MPEHRLQRTREANDEEQGEAHSVYMRPVPGGFKCSNCEYYASANRCEEPHIIKLLGAQSDGMAKVEPDACSDYFEPRDEEWEGDSDAGDLKSST